MEQNNSIQRMRSKSSGVEAPANGVLGVPQSESDMGQEEELGLSVKSLKAKVQQKEPEDRLEVISEKGVKKSIVDLSKKDLFKMLGIMEGEVQAREDIISMLKCKQTTPEVLESRYGSATPAPALQALQRDSIITGTKHYHPSVYQKPMVEVRREPMERENYILYVTSI